MMYSGSREMSMSSKVYTLYVITLPLRGKCMCVCVNVPWPIVCRGNVMAA